MDFFPIICLPVIAAIEKYWLLCISPESDALWNSTNLKSFNWFTWIFQDNFRCIDTETKLFYCNKMTSPHPVLSLSSSFYNSLISKLTGPTHNEYTCACTHTHTKNLAQTIPKRFITVPGIVFIPMGPALGKTWPSNPDTVSKGLGPLSPNSA